VATVVIPDLDDEVFERLKTRAAGNERTLEAELRVILTGASRQLSDAEARARSEAMRQRLSGRVHSDSAELIREDRDSR
jgi:plasmid stability protein